MDIHRQLQNLEWCKTDWPKPNISEKAMELLKESAQIPETELISDIEEIIRKSKLFPVEHPVENGRMENLKDRVSKENLKKNIASTHPLLHWRVLHLMAEFLVFKREYGSSIEKEFYKEMTIPEFIDRLLQKRAVSFLGANDRYKLITGETGERRAVGTLKQSPPLVLENCLSYDEIKISALLYVTGHTECINDGLRRNAGKIDDSDIERSAVIVGVIGARFKRLGRMDYEDMVISKKQNVAANGYGQPEEPIKRAYRQLWENFYQIDSLIYNEVTSHVDMQNKRKEKMYGDRFVWLQKDGVIFDNLTFHRRTSIITETSLLEANRRASEESKYAYLNVIGCGLGVWRISRHQNDVFVLSFLQRTSDLMRKGLLNNVSDINFAYIGTHNKITAMFNSSSDSENDDTTKKKMFLKYKDHPKGGINVQLEDREPSSRLNGEHEGKLLVMTYPWDGNAHPGNEFWIGKLWSSGDPAAACSTQISELHNAHVNANVRASNAHVATDSGVAHIRDYTRSSTDT
ncbi:hypothetical protein K1T71_012695 [Dendrolimus kikuchii]|uniref:Uncharacterized protein n=1 Tax=Dendrolimus kikuchii TaxID=765133 RepID=A0ACC1CK54_9NEOP|nr:hypothetical protein K1T71_012695 [Dendrolimus kikuchii]